MQKIPTLFRRDPDDLKRVLTEVNPGCEWVLAGEGVATRKFDGTCVRLDERGAWWARRELKPGKAAPANFQAVMTDETTGKTVGWEPVDQSGFAKWHALALAEHDGEPFVAGTYELCGPKVNGNPEGYANHVLVSHDAAPTAVELSYPITFADARAAVLALREQGVEGIVWHHPDGRMAKLKGRDFV
jgi:hypothetical protein